ncbi:MAG: hypothetical protein ABJB97_01285 [Acidobacteriota bacterium]
MNRNQKIGIGCGAAGCLGLLLIVVIGLAVYASGYWKNYLETNRNRTANQNVNLSQDSNSNSDSNSSDSGSSSLSDDEKHKLFQAAGITKDNDLIMKVLSKIGFDSGTGDAYQQFVKDHFAWAMNNLDFMKTVDTPEKGRAYVEEHLED